MAETNLRWEWSVLVVRMLRLGRTNYNKVSYYTDTKERPMDLNKAKEMAGEHRDKIQDGADKFIDGKLDGDKADKAKDGLNKGMDKVFGEGDK
ncbi:antitoxin [Corynebacterium macclintockiae]